MSSETVLPEFPPAWRAVSLGMKCLSVATLMLFVGIVFLPVFVVVQHQLLGEFYAAMELHGRGIIPIGPLLIAFFVMVMGLLVWLGGLCLCALAPVESGVRTFAMSGIACWVLFVIVVSQTSFLSAIGFASINTRDAIEPRHPQRIVAVNELGFGAAATFLAIAAGVLTACVLAAVAHHYRNLALAQSIQRFIVYQIGAVILLVFLGFLYLYLAALWKHAGLWLSGPFAFGALVEVAIGCSWLLRILKNVRAMLALAEENTKPLGASEQGGASS